MNDKDWTLLAVLAQEKNLTRTAQKLYLTQPAVTRRIQQLEAELGRPILIRSARGAELSSEGEYLAEYARQSLARLGELKQYMDNSGEHVRGQLRIACASAYACRCLPRLVKSISALYPAVDIRIVTGNSQSVYASLISGEVHAAILRGSFSWPEEILTLRADPSYYAVSAFPLNLDELPSLPQIQTATDAALEAEFSLWWTGRYKKPPRISTVVDRADICLEMVRQGLGYSLLSGLYIEDCPQLYRQKIVHADGTEMRRVTRAFCRRSSLSIKAVSALWDYLRACAAEEPAE